MDPYDAERLDGRGLLYIRPRVRLMSRLARRPSLHPPPSALRDVEVQITAIRMKQAAV